jgi:cytosine deaminase
MTSPAEMRACFDMVTEVNAEILGLEDYGLHKGAQASLVVLEASDPVEALRLRATRRLVISRGRIVAERDPSPTRLTLPGRPDSCYRRFTGAG